MNHKNITPGTLVEGSVSSTVISSDEINQLKAQMQDMQLEIDILKETINVLKKDPDIDQSALSEYSCAMKSHFRKFGNQMSGSGNHLCKYTSLLA